MGKSDLKEKKILITGGSKGLGKSAALSFSEDGATIMICGRDENSLEKVQNSLTGDGHSIYAGDMITNQGIEGLLKAVNNFGDLDIILHCMGGGLGKSASLISGDDLDLIYQVNLRSAVRINHSLIPKMQNRKTGNVIHVISSAATQAIASVGYNTIKAALAAYVRSLGNSLANSGVIVTGIMPGRFNSPGGSWERLRDKNPDLVKDIENEQPKGRFGESKEIIPLLKLLASRKAKMMIGSCVPIDGGESLSYEI